MQWAGDRFVFVVRAAVVVVLAIAALAALDATPVPAQQSQRDREIAEWNRDIVIETKRLARDPKNSSSLNNRGASYANKGDHDKAIADYSEAIRLNPKFSLPFCNRGESYNEKGQFNRAIEDLNEAIRLEPDYASAFSNRGFSYNGKREFDRAIEDLNEAIRLKPDLAEAFSNRGVSYSGKGEFDRAIEDHNQAIRLRPDYIRAFYNRGVSYYDKGDYDKAVADYGEAIKRDPKYSAALVGRGIAYQKKQQFNLATADFQAVLKIDPKNEEALRGRDAVRQLLAKAITETAPKPAAPAKEQSDIASRTRPQAGLPKLPPETSRSDQVAKLDPTTNGAKALDARTPIAAISPPGKRVALVMGNADYRSVTKLSNTITDARTMRDTLQKAGFEVVYGEDLDKRAMGRLIGEFGSIVKDSEAAVVYFAGHGSTFSDIPYVVPIDSKYENLENIPNELIQVESLVAEMRRAKGVRLVILDACRDNQREVELRRQEAALRGEAKRGGDVTRGLAKLQNPNGLIVVYATQYMSTAADGSVGANSPFTGSLARFLLTPNLDIKDVLFRAGQDVITKTGGTQRPEISISLYDEFVLVRQ